MPFFSNQIYRRSHGLIHTKAMLSTFSKVYLAQQLEAGQVYAWQEERSIAGVAVAVWITYHSPQYLDAGPTMSEICGSHPLP